jgi:hypothetical protein
MKKLFIIINPNDYKKAKELLLSLEEGNFVLPCLYKMEIPSDEEELTLAFLEYLLTGLDFEIAISTKVI